MISAEQWAQIEDELIAAVQARLARGEAVPASWLREQASARLPDLDAMGVDYLVNDLFERIAPPPSTPEAAVEEADELRRFRAARSGATE